MYISLEASVAMLIWFVHRQQNSASWQAMERLLLTGRRPCGVGTSNLVALAGGWVNETSLRSGIVLLNPSVLTSANDHTCIFREMSLDKFRFKYQSFGRDSDRHTM